MFKFNGISSEKMGVIVEEEDFIKRAPIIFDKTVINGRNGSIYTNDNTYDDVVSSFTISLLKNNFDEILSWLQGKGVFEYGDREVEMMIYDELDLNRKSSIKTATVNYIRRPIWHDADDCFVSCEKNVQNLGNAVAYPIIKLEGDGVVDITINNVKFSYTFDSDKQVIIDCKDKTEKWNGTIKSKNLKIGFEYPFLVPGNNQIKLNGNIKISIKRRSAYL